MTNTKIIKFVSCCSIAIRHSFGEKQGRQEGESMKCSACLGYRAEEHPDLLWLYLRGQDIFPNQKGRR